MNNYYWIPIINQHEQELVEMKRKYEQSLISIKNMEVQLNQLHKENVSLKVKISKLKNSRQRRGRRRIKRRNQQDIVKEFSCIYAGCQKKYASDLAVNLHIKIKHNGGAKKDRKEETLFDAKVQGFPCHKRPSISQNKLLKYIEKNQMKIYLKVKILNVKRSKKERINKIKKINKNQNRKVDLLTIYYIIFLGISDRSEVFGNISLTFIMLQNYWKLLFQKLLFYNQLQKYYGTNLIFIFLTFKNKDIY